MKINILILILIFFLFSIQTIAQEEEKIVNYFIGLQVKYNNDIAGKTSFFQYDDYWNYTNKEGYSTGLAIQNGVAIKKWVAILNVGFSQKNMSQTYSFPSGWYPIVFGEINYKIPYFNSEFSIGRKVKISKENAIQFTVGYGIEKNLKSDFSGDFTNPNDATVYYQYKASFNNKIQRYFNAKIGLVVPFAKNELVIGVSVSSIVDEIFSMQIKEASSSNLARFASTSINYRRKALGIFLTYRFL